MVILEKRLGGEHPDLASTLNNLGSLYQDQGNYAEAQRRLDRAIEILQKTSADPELQWQCYNNRAELYWKNHRREEALADQRRAMDLAERMRSHASGSETDQATLFGGYARVFERMVAWQTELGDFAQALTAAERVRARSLVDQMRLQGRVFWPACLKIRPRRSARAIG